MKYTGTFESFQLNIFVENSLLNISHNFVVIYLDTKQILAKLGHASKFEAEANCKFLVPKSKRISILYP